MPFYLEQTLGGPNTLRGYAVSRFRDRAVVSFSAEYRFLVNGYLDIGPYVDAGTVAHSFTKLDFGDLELSGGIRAGLRYKGRVLFNVGWGFCHEGSRFFIGAGTLF